MLIKNEFLIKLLISFSLYRYIFNSINDPEIKDSKTELNKLKNNIQVRNSNNNHRKLNIKMTEEIINYINNVNSYLKDNCPCKIYNIEANLAENLKIEKKLFYCLEIKHPNGKFKYYLYDPKYRSFVVNIDSCEEVNITDNNITLNFSDYYKDYDHLLSNLEHLKNVINIGEVYYPVYTDPCYQVTLLGYYEALLDNIKRGMENIRISVCEKDCEFEGLNLENFEIKCYCKEKIDMNKESFGKQIMYQFKNFGNFQVLKCYKLFFQKSGQSNNYASQILIFIIIINIFNIIYTIYSICNKKYYNLIIFFKNCYSDLKKIKKLNFNNLSLQSLTDEQKLIIDNLCNYIKKNSNNHNNIKNINNNNGIIIINESERNNIGNNSTLKNKIIKLLDNGELKDYYNCIMNLFPKEDYHKYLIEDELNGLNYEEYIKMEYRNFFDIFWSIFKTNYDFFSTFFIFENKDYKIYSIKVINYLNTLLLSLDINISFYNDDTMHKIYEDVGENYSLNRLPIILLTNALSLIPSFLFEIFFSYDFIELKINMDEDDDEESIQNSHKIILIKFINCCIFTLIFDIFSWYYISCFFAVYLGTQKAIFFDFLLEFGLNILSFLLLSIIYSIIKISFVKFHSNNRKHNITKCIIIFIMNCSLIIIIFSTILQYLISLIFS